MHKESNCEAPLSVKTIHISSKWFPPATHTHTHLPLHTHTHSHSRCAPSPVRFLARRWVRVFVWNINRPFAPLLLCLRAGCWPCVSGPSLRPSVGYRHQGGFREGALSPRQGSPESSTALVIDTLDLLGDGASKRSNLPDHCTCYKGHWYVNAAAYHQPLGEPSQSLCHFWRGADFSAVYVLFMLTFVERHFGHRALDKMPRIPLESLSLKTASLVWKTI